MSETAPEDRISGPPPAPRPADFTSSASIGKLAGALAKAQGAFESIAKTRTVQVRSEKGNYSFDYAPLDEVLRAVRPHLAANGLSFTQLISGSGERKLTTVLLHESGEWMSTTTLLPASAGNRAQELGSTITYMRRYTLLSLLGVVADEDDDGNAGDGNQRTASDRGPKGQQTRGPSSTPPSQPGSRQTQGPANASGPSSANSPAPGNLEGAQKLDLALMSPKDAQDGRAGLGLTKSQAFDWLKDVFGKGAANSLSADQQKDGLLLAVAQMAGQFDDKRAELAKTGRCKPGKERAA